MDVTADRFTERLENSYDFRVDTYFEDYPDVIFEVILNAEPTEEQIETAVFALEDFMEKYNRFHFVHPIHYVSDIEGLPDRNHPGMLYFK